MILAKLEDTEWKKQAIAEVRHTVRVIAVNDHDEYAFLRIVGEDAFGQRDHLETIGGGIEENESEEAAIHREVMEEIGYTCEIIGAIGEIVDRYYLIKRETHSHFYAVRLGENIGQIKRTPLEQMLIAEVVWLKEGEVLPILENERAKGINRLIQQRDACAFAAYLKQKSK